MTITRQLVRERTHVARTLNVVLTAQRIHAHTFTATLPVAIARFAIPMTIVEPWRSVTPRP